MVLISSKKLTLRALVTVLFLLVSFSSNADVYAPPWVSSSGTVDDALSWCQSAYNLPTQQPVSLQRIDARYSRCIYHYNGNPVNGVTWALTVYQTCPEGTQDDGTGRCEVQSCPEGQVNIGTPETPDCEDICHSGASENYTMEFGNVPYAGIGSTGCGLTYDKTKQPKCVLSDPVKCTFFYTQSGEYLGTVEGQDPFEIIALPDAEPAEQTSFQEYEKTPETVTTDTEGNVTTEYSETTTNTKDQGTEVVQIGDNLYLKNSSGEIIEIVKQQTINSYTDGSSQVTTTETKTSTPATIEQTIRDLLNGTTSQSTIIYGNSGTLSSTIIKTYNTQGKLTDTQVTTTGEINTACTGDCGDSDGDGEGGTFSADYTKGNYNQALSDTQQQILDLKQQLSDKLDDIKTQASSLLTIPFAENSQGSLPCPDPLDLGFTTIQMCLANYEDSLSILALAIYFGLILLGFFYFLR